MDTALAREVDQRHQAWMIKRYEEETRLHETLTHYQAAATATTVVATGGHSVCRKKTPRAGRKHLKVYGFTELVNTPQIVVDTIAR